jgi:hypothetical protein
VVSKPLNATLRLAGSTNGNSLSNLSSSLTAFNASCYVGFAATVGISGSGPITRIRSQGRSLPSPTQCRHGAKSVHRLFRLWLESPTCRTGSAQHSLLHSAARLGFGLLFSMRRNRHRKPDTTRQLQHLHGANGNSQRLRAAEPLPPLRLFVFLVAPFTDRHFVLLSVYRSSTYEQVMSHFHTEDQPSEARWRLKKIKSFLR